MAYITRKELELAAGDAERLRQLSRDDAALIADCIAYAEGVAHKHLRRLYGVPMVEPVDPDLKRLIAAEAVFELMRRRGMVSEDDRIAHEERIAEFVAYGKGEVAAPPGATKGTSVLNASAGPSETRAWSRDALKGYS